MYFIYGASLVLWLMLMDVGAEKTWAPFDISKPKHLVQLLFRCLIAALVTWLMVSVVGSYKGVFNPSGAMFAPFSAVFYYVIHILFNRKHRESWKEYLAFDRWNAAAMLGCLIIAFSSSVLS